MLRIDNNSNIYLTKGDSGIINIKLDNIPEGYNKLEFYVRQSSNLDNIIFQLPDDNKGTISFDENTLIYTITLLPAATADIKRKTYVYDFKLTGTDLVAGTNLVTTFLGGDVNKMNFVVT